MKPQEIYC